MRIVAARFVDAAAARDAVALLRSRLDLGATDVSVAPLGGADHPAGDASLLAGRFVDPRVHEVREIIRRAGGEIVADVDERWTRRRSEGSQADAGWKEATSTRRRAS